jgi:hypothetical protein
MLHQAFVGDLTAKWREAHIKELMEEMEIQSKALENPSIINEPNDFTAERNKGA